MLQFKDIQSNHPVFILNKQDLTVTQGKVINAAFARVDNSNGMPQMVRDIDIEMNGKIATYSIHENLSITYANKGDVVIATERSGLANEITAMRNTAKQVLESVDRHKAVIEKADTLLADLDPFCRAQLFLGPCVQRKSCARQKALRHGERTQGLKRYDV